MCAKASRVACICELVSVSHSDSCACTPDCSSLAQVCRLPSLSRSVGARTLAAGDLRPNGVARSARGGRSPCAGDLVLVHRCASTHTLSRPGRLSGPARTTALARIAVACSRRVLAHNWWAVGPHADLGWRCHPTDTPQVYPTDATAARTHTGPFTTRATRESVEVAPDRPTTFVAPIVVIHLNL